MQAVFGDITFKIDDDDADILSKKSWWVSRGRLTRQIGTGTERKNIYFYQEVLGFPDGVIDHINRDASDNRKENLRVCSPQQNSWNRKGHSRCGYKGVSAKKRRFVARIKANGKLITIGSYATPELAAHAYDAAASIHFGQFAHLNFPRHVSLPTAARKHDHA